MQDAKQILINNSLKITEQRLMILNEIISLKKTFTADLLYKKFQNNIDQATIYRTLHTFINKKIITEIPNTNDINSYELTDPYNTTHPHLYCKKCKNMICLDCLKNSDIERLTKYSNNYSIDNIFIQFTGTCDKCK